MPRSFEDIAIACGWNSDTQVSVLLDYIRNQDSLNDLDNYAEQIAAEEQDAPIPDDEA